MIRVLIILNYCTEYRAQQRYDDDSTAIIVIDYFSFFSMTVYTLIASSVFYKNIENKISKIIVIPFPSTTVVT